MIQKLLRPWYLTLSNTIHLSVVFVNVAVYQLIIDELLTISKTNKEIFLGSQTMKPNFIKYNNCSCCSVEFCLTPLLLLTQGNHRC